MCDSGGLTKGYRDNFDRRIMCEYFAMVCFNTLNISYSTRPATFVLRLVADHQYTDARRHRVHVADPLRRRRELLRVQVALQRNSPLKRNIFALTLLFARPSTLRSSEPLCYSRIASVACLTPRLIITEDLGFQLAIYYWSMRSTTPTWKQTSIREPMVISTIMLSLLVSMLALGCKFQVHLQALLRGSNI